MPETLSDEERLERAVKSVRTYLRDKKELNRLLGHQFETTDDEVKAAIMEALMDWNVTPPPLARVTLANHPAKNLLVECAAYHVLYSASLWHSREQMPSSDGGTSGDDHAKAEPYIALAERIRANYEDKRDRIKVAMNFAAAIDTGSASEYGAWAYIYGNWW